MAHDDLAKQNKTSDLDSCPIFQLTEVLNCVSRPLKKTKKEAKNISRLQTLFILIKAVTTSDSDTKEH